MGGIGSGRQSKNYHRVNTYTHPDTKKFLSDMSADHGMTTGDVITVLADFFKRFRPSDKDLEYMISELFDSNSIR